MREFYVVTDAEISEKVHTVNLPDESLIQLSAFIFPFSLLAAVI